MLAFLPSRVGMPAANLDGSWVAVLHEAARQRWQFGEEVVFTYGPLGFLAVPSFAPDIFWWLVAFHVATGAVCGLACVAVGRDAGAPAWLGPAALLVLLPPTAASVDTLLLLPLVLWMVLGLSPAGERQQRVLLAVSVVVGALALVKFTLFLLASALAVLLFVDDAGRRRRVPMPTIVYVATVLIMWVAAGQHLAGLPAWLATSWETSSAYSVAMSTPVGPYQRRELLVFALNAVALAGMSAWLALGRRRSHLAALLPVVGVLVVLFVLFKLGFVRQDAHVTAALFAMPMLGALVGAGTLAVENRHLKVLAVVVVLLGMGSYSYGLRRHFDRLAPPEHYRASYAFQWRALRDVAQPWRTHLRLTSEHAASLNALRGTLELPHLDGSVDLYTHQQALLLAHAVAYAPRPVFQSYAAYSARLAEINRRALSSDRGARHVLYAPETIDHRYPLMDDGASLPVLMTAFDSVGLVGAFAHLERRAIPRGLTVTPHAAVVAGAGQDVPINAGTAPLWARIELETTWTGRLVAAAYKLPPVYLDVQTADGTTRRHRIVPDLSREGMLVSPLVRTADEFLQLMDGQAAGPRRQVTSIRLVVDWPFAYARDIRVRLFRLTVEPSPEALAHSSGPRPID